MGWHLLQAAILLAVVFSNIHWQWTPNGYLAGILGVVAAWLVTAALSGLLSLKQKARRVHDRL
jgi:hypothetical protein